MTPEDRRFDVAVVGLGAMGSSAAWTLAREGLRVVGFDRFTPPHTMGSSHGHTRIIREAYFEHPLYVPLVRRAFEGWARLEAVCGKTLMRATGGLMVGREDGMLLRGTRASVEAHELPHETLSASEIRRRFPMFRPDGDMCGILEARAGVLLPERCIEAFLDQAARGGAVLRTGERVEAWRVETGGVVVRTSGGEEVLADRLVLTAGAWMSEVLRSTTPRPEIALAVGRQLFHRFAPVDGREDRDAAPSPISIWEYEPDRCFYTLPDSGGGVKIGIHHFGAEAHPDSIDRQGTPEEEEEVRALLRRYLPGANGPIREAGVCMYTSTPDRHFILDRHPASERVVVVSACSGHGFKFASVIGELVADLVQGRETPFDLSPFRLDRPALRNGA